MWLFLRLKLQQAMSPQRGNQSNWIIVLRPDSSSQQYGPKHFKILGIRNIIIIRSIELK